MRFEKARLSYSRPETDGSIEVCFDCEELLWHKKFSDPKFANAEVQAMGLPVPERRGIVDVIADTEELANRNFTPEVSRRPLRR